MSKETFLEHLSKTSTYFDGEWLVSIAGLVRLVTKRGEHCPVSAVGTMLKKTNLCINDPLTTLAANLDMDMKLTKQIINSADNYFAYEENQQPFKDLRNEMIKVTFAHE